MVAWNNDRQSNRRRRPHGGPHYGNREQGAGSSRPREGGSGGNRGPPNREYSGGAGHGGYRPPERREPAHGGQGYSRQSQGGSRYIPNERGGYDRAARGAGGGRGYSGGGAGGFRGPPGAGSGSFQDKRARFMKRSKESVMQALRSRDMLLASVTKAQDDLDKTINLLGERLEDWYGIYFPELRAEDKLKYAEATLVIDRDKFDETQVMAILGPKAAAALSEAVGKSLGAKISDKDMEQCKALSKTIISLDTLRREYGSYQKEIALELCPNMAAVGGYEIAAKLVSHVGSLQKLAILPASAIQVLGAEKALFKHLKNRNVPPPKHGIIFQHPKISSSPRMVRGKIARALANKLCLAAKADAFSKRDISADLKKDFEERFAEIMKGYENAKAKGLAPKVDAPQE